MTKSTNLWLYPEFFPYHDPADIPFDEIASKYPDVTANQLRGMMRPAKKNETIFIALVDQLGFDPEVIPYWFARPERITIKRRKKASRPAALMNPSPVVQQTKDLAPQPELPNVLFPKIHIPVASQVLSESQKLERMIAESTPKMYIDPKIGLIIDLNPQDDVYNESLAKFQRERKQFMFRVNLNALRRQRLQDENNVISWACYMILNQSPVKRSVSINGFVETITRANEDVMQMIKSNQLSQNEEKRKFFETLKAYREVIEKDEIMKKKLFSSLIENTTGDEENRALGISKIIQQYQLKKKARLEKIAQTTDAPYAAFLSRFPDRIV